jgi:hypothetical protein
MITITRLLAMMIALPNQGFMARSGIVLSVRRTPLFSNDT